MPEGDETVPGAAGHTARTPAGDDVDILLPDFIIAVAPVVAAPVARQNGVTLRQQMIAAGRLIPADAQTPSLPAPDPDFAPDPVSALDFAI